MSRLSCSDEKTDTLLVEIVDLHREVSNLLQNAQLRLVLNRLSLRIHRQIKLQERPQTNAEESQSENHLIVAFRALV